MSDKLSELLPCPFCGGAVDLEQTIDKRNWWGVKCRNTLNLGGTCAIEQIPSASPEAAVERWNRRRSPAPAIPAGAVAPFGWVQPRGGNYFTRSEVAAKRIGGLIPVYASPSASIAPAISESEDTKRLDFIANESVDLVCFEFAKFEDAEIGWRVLEHHMREPEPRVIGEVYRDDPRAAIDAARKGEKS